MSIAQTFADFHAVISAHSGDTLRIYSDGVVILLECSRKREAVIGDLIGLRYPEAETARSKDGLVSAWVVRCVPPAMPEDIDPVLSGPTIMGSVADCRMDDLHDLDSASHMIERVVAAL
jgi:hypothetical protein